MNDRVRIRRLSGIAAGAALLAATGLVLAGFTVVVAPTQALAGEPGDPLPSADWIVERYIEALGGREALESVKTKVFSGRFIDDRPYRGPVVVVPFEATSSSSGKWVMTHDWADGAESEGFDGEDWWDIRPGEIEREPGMKRSKMAFHLDARGPLRIGDYFRDMRVVGVRWMNERRVYAVETDRDPTYYTLYFDMESGLLSAIGYHNEIGDYRDVGGVLVPFRFVFGRKGGSNTYDLDEVRLNAPVDVEAFAAPAY